MELFSSALHEPETTQLHLDPLLQPMVQKTLDTVVPPEVRSERNAFIPE